MVRRAKPFVGIGECAAAVAAGFLVASAWMAPTSAADDGDQEARESSAQPVRRRRPTDPRRQALQGLNPLEHLRRGEHVVSPLPNGRQAELSIEAGLQDHLEQLLERYEVPFAGVVAMEPDSGRVLAYVSHSSANPDAGRCLRSSPVRPLWTQESASIRRSATPGGDPGSPLGTSRITNTKRGARP